MSRTAAATTRADKVLDAFGDPTRRRVFERLRHRTRSVREIADGMKVSRPAVSQHLKVLREAKLVQMEKRGQQHIYQIKPDAMRELEKWVKRMTKMWDERFDALDKLLLKEKKKYGKKESDKNHRRARQTRTLHHKRV